MKKIIVFVFILFIGCVKSNKDGFIIKGKLENSMGFTEVYLDLYTANGLSRITKAHVNENGEFMINIEKLEEDGFFQLGISNSSSSSIFLSKGAVINFEADALNMVTDYIVSGTKDCVNYVNFFKLNSELNKNIQDLSSSFGELLMKDPLSPMIENMRNIRDSLLYSKELNAKIFMEENIESMISLAALEVLDFENNLPIISKLKKQIEKNYADNTIVIQYIKKINAKINDLQNKLKVGEILPKFELPNELGQKVNLDNYKGKYVLVDFWASWCSPCRKTNPKLIEAYERFKSFNFEIISISVDENKDNWLEAVQSDKMIWTNLSDLKGWSSPILNIFMITKIPANFLVNIEGKIIGVDLFGNNLQVKLYEIFKVKKKINT